MQFLFESRLQVCQIFGRFRYFISKSEPNFGYPHTLTGWHFFTDVRRTRDCLHSEGYSVCLSVICHLVDKLTVVNECSTGLVSQLYVFNRTEARCRRPVRPGQTYGRVFCSVRTARNYVPYVRVVCTDHPYVRAVCTAWMKKALSCNAFSSYGPYVRVVCTVLPYVRPVKPRDFTLSSVIKFTLSRISVSCFAIAGPTRSSRN